MKNENGKYICPACGYPNLKEQPWLDENTSSFEICPSCGIEFGYDDMAGGNVQDREEFYRQWRERWIKSGMQWWDRSRLAPSEWDPKKQLTNL